MTVVVIDKVQLKRSSVSGARPSGLSPGEEFVNFADGLRWVGELGVAFADLIPAPLNADVIVRQSLGEALAGRVIMSAGGNLARVADPTSVANVGKVLGVAVIAAQTGGPIYIRRAGPFAGTFAFGSAGPLFIGDNGALTRTARTSGFSQVIGYSTNGVDAFIALGDPVIFSDDNSVGTPGDTLAGLAYITPDADYNIPSNAAHVAIGAITASRKVVLPSWDVYPLCQDLIIADEQGYLDGVFKIEVDTYDIATSIIGTSDNKFVLSFSEASIRLRKCYTKRAWVAV